MSLAEQLRARREALGLTQRDVADRAHLELHTVYNVEKGRTLPRMGTLEAMVAALECELQLVPAALRAVRK
jgi:transcriptional regulator with XRE-family HTH domain